MKKDSEYQADIDGARDGSSTDRVARDAAELVHAGRVDSIAQAIDLAMDMQHAEPRDRPGSGTVRRHIQAMTMQAVGAEAYRDMVRRVLDVAEQAMTAIDLAFDDVTCVVTGRSARGQIDGGVVVTIRLHTDRPLEDIEAHLEELGYEDLRTSTVSTRYGRMNQLHALDDEQAIVFTRIPRGMPVDRSQNLFKEKPIVTLGLDELRDQLMRMD